MTVIPGACFFGCTGMTTVDCDLAHVTSIESSEYGHAFAECTSLLPPSLSKKDADPAAVLAYLKEMASNEREAARAAELAARAAELEVERARVAELEHAARAAEDSLLAELDAEGAKQAGSGKKKKKKKPFWKVPRGKKEGVEQEAGPSDLRTDFQRYEQSDMRREVDQRKRQRNLEEAAKVMVAHAQAQAETEMVKDVDAAQIAVLGHPPAASPAPAQTETLEDMEARIVALGLLPSLGPAPPAAPDALAETAEDIEAQIAALGPPPDFSPAPPPAAAHPAAPDAFMEALLDTAAPPAPSPQSLMERVRLLHLEVCGEETPAGIGVAAAVALVEEGLLGGVRKGGVKERVGVLEEFLYG
jgi:hypothetical protein